MLTSMYTPTRCIQQLSTLRRTLPTRQAFVFLQNAAELFKMRTISPECGAACTLENSAPAFLAAQISKVPPVSAKCGAKVQECGPISPVRAFCRNGGARPEEKQSFLKTAHPQFLKERTRSDLRDEVFRCFKKNRVRPRKKKKKDQCTFRI